MNKISDSLLVNFSLLLVTLLFIFRFFVSEAFLAVNVSVPSGAGVTERKDSYHKEATIVKRTRNKTATIFKDRDSLSSRARVSLGFSSCLFYRIWIG